MQVMQVMQVTRSRPQGNSRARRRGLVGRGLVGAGLVGLGLISLTACIVGARAVVDVAAEYSLRDIDAVRIELPDTPLAVRGVPNQDSLLLDGRWYAVGGTRPIAEESTAVPAFDFETSANFARLTALVPLNARELVDLEVDEITLAPDRDVELWTGLGNVTVTHMEGNVSVDIDRGDIFIVGGAGGVAAHTEIGDAEIQSRGNIDVFTGQGHLLVRQDGQGGNSVYATSEHGDIEVRLKSDMNLDVRISAFGDIRVQTGTISTVTSETFEREVGNGTVKLWLEARIGSVTVQLDDVE